MMKNEFGQKERRKFREWPRALFTENLLYYLTQTHKSDLGSICTLIAINNTEIEIPIECTQQSANYLVLSAPKPD
jgi:hypothetical protein